MAQGPIASIESPRLLKILAFPNLENLLKFRHWISLGSLGLKSLGLGADSSWLSFLVFFLCRFGTIDSRR